MSKTNARFVRKIQKMTDQELEDYVENLSSKIATANLLEVEGILQQMEIINEIIEENIHNDDDCMYFLEEFGIGDIH